MTITVGVDTYSTLAEADAYAAYRSWTDWAALTDTQKEARLVDAAVYLDQSYTWKGRVTLLAQTMAWPRIEVEDKEGRPIDSDVTPARIKEAQVELARLITATAGLVANDSSGDVSQLTAGSVSLTFKNSQNASEAAKYRSIDRLVRGLYVSRSGGASTRRLLKA